MRHLLLALPLALLALPPAHAGDAPKPKMVCSTSAPTTGSRLGQRKCVVQKAEAKPQAKAVQKAAAKPGTQTAKR